MFDLKTDPFQRCKLHRWEIEDEATGAELVRIKTIEGDSDLERSSRTSRREASMRSDELAWAERETGSSGEEEEEDAMPGGVENK